jgi:hypothetical protein
LISPQIYFSLRWRNEAIAELVFFIKFRDAANQVALGIGHAGKGMKKFSHRAADKLFQAYNVAGAISHLG